MVSSVKHWLGRMAREVFQTVIHWRLGGGEIFQTVIHKNFFCTGLRILKKRREGRKISFCKARFKHQNDKSTHKMTDLYMKLTYQDNTR
jgi:hypothetical protein